jgi:hypothetical protein
LGSSEPPIIFFIGSIIRSIGFFFSPPGAPPGGAP